MDKSRYEAIAHKKLQYCSPSNDEMIDEITDLMHLTPGMTIADIGCAKAEILIRMAHRCQVKAIGIDSSEQFLDEAEAAIALTVPAADITLKNAVAKNYGHPSAPYDAIMCINSSELFGGYDNTLSEITRLSKSGGMVL